jgi:hypothetical protein
MIQSKPAALSYNEAITLRRVAYGQSDGPDRLLSRRSWHDLRPLLPPLPAHIQKARGGPIRR